MSTVVAAQMQAAQLPSARLMAHVLAAQVPAVTTSLGSGPTACPGLLFFFLFYILFLGKNSNETVSFPAFSGC